MRLHIPFAPSNQLQTRAVDHEVQGPVWDDLRLASGKDAASSARGGVIWNRKFEPEQPEHAPDDPFSLAQGQVEDEPPREPKFDRQIRVAGLTARRGSPGSTPSCDGILIQSEGQVASLLQPGLALGPVSKPILGPEARMAGVLGHEHSGSRWQVGL